MAPTNTRVCLGGFRGNRGRHAHIGADGRRQRTLCLPVLPSKSYTFIDVRCHRNARACFSSRGSSCDCACGTGASPPPRFLLLSSSIRLLRSSRDVLLQTPFPGRSPQRARACVTPGLLCPFKCHFMSPLPLRQISCHCPFKCPFVTFSAFVPLKFPPVFVSLKLRFPFVHLNIRLLSLSIGELFLMSTPLFRTHFEQCSLNYFCRRPKG